MAQGNPLLNHLVIENVMKYLEWKEWLYCRKVCSIWNQVILRKYLPANSIVHPDISSLLSEPHLISEYFTDFNVKISSVESCPPNLLDLFWTLYSEQIQSLRLEITTIYATTRLKWILERLSNLEKLTLVVSQFWGESFCQIDDQEKNLYFNFTNCNLNSFTFLNLTSIKMYGEDHVPFRLPFTFQQILTFYQHLKNICVVGVCPEDVDDLITAHNSSKNCLEKLEILDENMCCESLSNTQIKNIFTSSQPLKELHIELSYHLEPQSFLQFLQDIPPSLKILKLRRFPLPSLLPLPLNHSLPFITTLHISQDLTDSLNFIQGLPSLKTLHVLLRDLSSLYPTTLFHHTHNPQPHPCLTTLLIEPPLLEPDCVKTMLQLCPQIISLTIRFDNEMLWTLCQSPPPFLAQLHVISHDGLDDKGFTGMEKGGYRPHPHIGLVKSLEKLTIEVWRDMHNKITDLSVHKGLIELGNLKEFLGIHKRKDHETFFMQDEMEIGRLNLILPQILGTVLRGFLLKNEIG